MPRLRISAISFLNTAPLMWDFEHGSAAKDFEIDYTVPSLCAKALAEGKADIGLIPAVTYLSIPELVVIPEIAIAARGPVRSILLISKVPVEEIRTVAADNASRTSVALCRLLLKKWMRTPPVAPSSGATRMGEPTKGQSKGMRQPNQRDEPEFIPMAAELEPMLAKADAALIIGDSALRVSHTEHAVFDLAEEWQRFTGKPFVFAFWAVRQEAANQELPAIFQRSAEHGLAPENLKAVCREWAPRVGISEAEVHGYLTQNLNYSLDAVNIAGLELFWQLAFEEGILPEPRPLRFVGEASAEGVAKPAAAAFLPS